VSPIAEERFRTNGYPTVNWYLESGFTAAPVTIIDLFNSKQVGCDYFQPITLLEPKA
jgi:hypothetical protein